MDEPIPLNDEDYWNKRGLTTSTPIRDKILVLATELLAKEGPESFNLKAICDPLFISRPLIYHYFGNQYGLMAEVITLAYRNYAERLKREAAAQSTPKARLETWMMAQAQWMQTHSGIAVVLQFPNASKKVTQELHERFHDDMLETFQFNMAVLATLVRGVERNQLLPLNFEAENAPYEELASDVGLLLRTSSVGMSALGASVWAAGRTSPSHRVDEINLNTAAVTQHIKWVAATPRAVDDH